VLIPELVSEIKSKEIRITLGPGGVYTAVIEGTKDMVRERMN